jgi:outer membrane lipoprotein carrier protein
MKRYWLFFLLWCLPNWLQANEILDNFSRGLHTLQAQFEQKIWNEKGRLLKKSQGKMAIQCPNRFNWEYQKPYTQLIVADGKKVWIYDKDLEQVIKKGIDKEVGKTPAFLLSSKRNIEEDFFVKQLPNSQQTGVTRLKLTPKDIEKSQFDSMYISIKGKDLLGFELMDNFGQITRITFTQFKRNQKLEKNLFIFTPPVGVDVIVDDATGAGIK